MIDPTVVKIMKNILKTNWYPVTINPIRSGLYEVNMKCWPWPTLVKWYKNKGWKNNAVNIIQWRGLKEKLK